MGEQAPFGTQKTTDANIGRLQEFLRRVIQVVNECPIIFGRRIVGVVFTSGSSPALQTTVDHGLSRTPTGFFVCKPGTVLTRYAMAATQPSDTTRQINITAAADTTVDIWVF